MGCRSPPVPHEAAPQILGVVASDGAPTSLSCTGAECGAHFSAFCLQEARPAPFAGQDHAAPGASMTLIVTTAAGQSIRLPAQDYVKITSQIGFTSVHVSVPQSVMTDLGAASLQIEVGENVSVLPIGGSRRRTAADK